MYKLHQGDCLELMKDIPDGSIDMILCDLPYGTTECKWDSIIPLDKLWEQYMRIIKENGVVVLTSAQPFTTKLIESNIKHYKYNYFLKYSTNSAIDCSNSSFDEFLNTLNSGIPSGFSKLHLEIYSSQLANFQVSRSELRSIILW